MVDCAATSADEATARETAIPSILAMLYWGPCRLCRGRTNGTAARRAATRWERARGEKKRDEEESKKVALSLSRGKKLGGRAGEAAWEQACRVVQAGDKADAKLWTRRRTHAPQRTPVARDRNWDSRRVRAAPRRVRRLNLDSANTRAVWLALRLCIAGYATVIWQHAQEEPTCRGAQTIGGESCSDRKRQPQHRSSSTRPSRLLPLQLRLSAKPCILSERALLDTTASSLL